MVPAPSRMMIFDNVIGMIFSGGMMGDYNIIGDVYNIISGGNTMIRYDKL